MFFLEFIAWAWPAGALSVVPDYVVLHQLLFGRVQSELEGGFDWINHGRGQRLPRGTTALAGPLPGLPETELVLRVWSVMMGLSMYVFIINISVAFRGPRFKPSWHLTRRERRGCNRYVPSLSRRSASEGGCAGSLSLGRWMQADYEHPSK